ncbi:DUF433 domain-containing protein [Okeania hirsuta]|uniref:DUF433 domain-containing protein n=1 Tax=Okeania hirsuta TaxID=1458930 RepID=A0A3N6PC29_9CYAN|nr:DUF433 domain-containing protein [Okeania sp. SIO1F9]RQH42267.1 DUF433 domain-containing protein [Okeania hirsuta]
MRNIGTLIVSISNICRGRPRITGTRIFVSSIAEELTNQLQKLKLILPKQILNLFPFFQSDYQ